MNENEDRGSGRGEDNSLDRLSEEFDMKTQLMAALMQEGITLTHFAAVAAYTDEDGDDFILVYGGPNQPQWLTKALLEKSISVWNDREEMEWESQLNNQYLNTTEDEDEDE